MAKLEICIIYDPEILFLGISPTEILTKEHKILCPNIVLNGKTLEST